MATADLTVIGLGRSRPERRRQGSVGDILDVVAELHAVPFEVGLPRVHSVLKLDERRDREQTLDDKVRSVEERLDEE